MPSTRVETPIGPVRITLNQDGVCQVDLLDLTQERTVFPEDIAGDEAQLQEIQETLTRYFEGEPKDFQTIPIAFTQGTSFQQAVWETIRKIPAGETRTYQWVAEQIGRPQAMRAVGQALRRNPVPLFIPCHRVVASNGKLGGFIGTNAQAIKMKAFLLRLEKALQS